MDQNDFITRSILHFAEVGGHKYEAAEPDRANAFVIGGWREESRLHFFPVVTLEPSAQTEVKTRVSLEGPHPYMLTGPHRCVYTGVDLLAS